MSRSGGVIRAITVSSSSKRRASLGGGTTGRKGKKHRKMGGKRHFEPVKRAEPRFPENPTNHSSPPARRRQKIAPLRHSSPPLRHSRPHRHLPTSFAHSVCLIPSHSSPPTTLLPTQTRRCQTPPSTKSCSHSRTPPSFTSPYCAACRAPIIFTPPADPSPQHTPHPGLAKHPNGTISTISPPPKHFSPHSLPSFSATSATLPVCRATLPKPSLPHVLNPPHIDGASKL